MCASKVAFQAGYMVGFRWTRVLPLSKKWRREKEKKSYSVIKRNKEGCSSFSTVIITLNKNRVAFKSNASNQLNLNTSEFQNQFLTSYQGFLQLDCTERRVSQRRQDTQVVWTKGNPQERSHGDEYQGHLFSEMDKHSVTLVTFIL